ncbi:DUF4159 domain-containing protein [bacterium]|nr:MAG: DUF4159 domain-containing protein [bacterium]
MTNETLLSQRITGIQPFNELAIDADVWREAHGQHHAHRVLHAGFVHRPGIVHGLEVVVSKTSEFEVIVAPGVAIDAQGRTVVVSDPVRFTPEEKGQSFIVLTYEDTLDARSEVMVGTGKKFYRLVEGRQIVVVKELPKGPYIELARVDRSNKTTPLRTAESPFDPAEDELNLLYRELAFPHCYADGGIGELCFLPVADPNCWKPNRAGLYNLVREANGAGFHVSFEGLFNLRNGGNPTDPMMLYVSCEGEFQPPSAEQIEGLRRYLDNGGTLVAEAAGGDAGFVKSFEAIATAVGAKPKPVENGEALLRSHGLFPSPPNGAVSGGTVSVDTGRGVILSTQDYGGAWQGRVPNAKAEDSRDSVRRAVEFGLNFIAFANRRRRESLLARMS